MGGALDEVSDIEPSRYQSRCISTQNDDGWDVSTVTWSVDSIVDLGEYHH